MKIGILGDTHFTNRSPERRIDNYWETLEDKLTQALTIFVSNDCDCIIQPGDFFDSSTTADRVKAVLIQLFKRYRLGVYCVAGQHDITGHSMYTLANSPLAVLQSAGVVKVVNGDCCSLGALNKDSNVQIYGAPFGEEVPKPFDYGYNILIIHKMIGNRPLYPGQDLTDPRRFLRQHPGYNLVVCGDYHYRFIETHDGRTILNPGAMVRKTISKFDLQHKPAVIIFDTETNETEVVKLNVKLPEEVFDLTKTTKKDNLVLLQFIERLKNQTGKMIEWKRILLEVLKERNANRRVKNIIDETLELVRMNA